MKAQVWVLVRDRKEERQRERVIKWSQIDWAHSSNANGMHVSILTIIYCLWIFILYISKLWDEPHLMLTIFVLKHRQNQEKWCKASWYELEFLSWTSAHTQCERMLTNRNKMSARLMETKQNVINSQQNSTQMEKLRWTQRDI